VVLDRLTGLVWTRNANRAEYPLAWQEALDHIATMNRDKVSGSADWRLPNRRELRSLMSHQTRMPALPEGHPFVNVFSGWYWTSTTAAINTAYACISIWKAHECFTAGRNSISCSGLFGERGTPSSLLPAKRGVMTQRDNSSPARDRDRTENSAQGCHGLNPALRKQEAWSSTGSRTSAGAHRLTSSEDRRPGGSAQSSERPQPTARRDVFMAAAEHQ